jgi:hypothetical protein
MVRITLAIPEELRYSLKLALMGHRRKDRSRLTQDEYCANAISAYLGQEQADHLHGMMADSQTTRAGFHTRPLLFFVPLRMR